MRDLSASFSRLAQTTFETAMRASGDREVLVAMNEVLEVAVRDIKRAGRPGRNGAEGREEGSRAASEDSELAKEDG